MKKVIPLIILIAMCGALQDVHAQLSGAPATTVNVLTSPENPGPHQSVIVTLDSSDTDLNAATMLWKVNNVVIKNGKGIKTAWFTTGVAGTQTILDITIITSGGEKIVKHIVLQPSQVDLIWQADGYVPPFYRGKTLFSYQDHITFVAVPHIIGTDGTEIPASNLIYTWTKNGTVLGDFNGYGKDTYTMTGSIIARPLDIQVEVTSPDTNATAQAETIVSPVDPQVLLYRNDPLYGIQFQKTLVGTQPLGTAKEMQVFAAPYYFGTTRPLDGSLTYQWSLNNSTIDSGGNQSKTFRPTSGESGRSIIGVSVQNSIQDLQQAAQNFTILFGN